MVPFTHKIVSSRGRTFSLEQNLTCADYGVYTTTCKLCSEQYVGQTVNKFSKRWTTHRSQWKANTQQKNDNAALRLHFANFHQDQINPQLSECYEITYVFKPYDPSNLDIYESQWIHKLKAKININKTIFSVM